MDILNIIQLNEYMNQPSGQARPSPRPGEHSDHDTCMERHCDPITVGDTESQYLCDFTRAPQSSEPLHGHQGFFNQDYGNTNDFDQYHGAHIESHMERSAGHNRQASAPSSLFAQHSDHVVLRGIEECAEATSPCTVGREVGREDAAFLLGTSSIYNMHQRSKSATSESSALPLMQSFPRHSKDATQDDQSPTRQTKYTPYQSRFEDAVAARNYRREALRFQREPYKDPDTDETIVDIEHDRNLHVMRIYNAMTSCESAKDNKGSPATKRWVNEAHYPADMVEAYAHKVFDCMIEQVKFGFRGWVHNDYVADERKGDDVDKDTDCAGRLDNIIMALEQEKTVCEDVMNSSCQVRMFVNAPRAYANRKHQNRVGNSKRGRTKDTPDPNPAPTKAARTSGRRTRARSTTASELPSSRDTTPMHQQSLPHVATHGPYYRPATAFPDLSSSPSVANQPVPRSTPMHKPGFSAMARSSYGQHSFPASSPPPTSSPLSSHAPQSQAPRTAAIPPHQHSPNMSYYRFRAVAPNTADEVGALTVAPPFDNWQNSGTFGERSVTVYEQDTTPVDPALLQQDFTGFPWEEDSFDPGHNEFVNPSELENQTANNGKGGSDLCNFQQYWSTRPGVQDFPQADGSSKPQ